ncbi:MAG: hypothetical protein CO186_10305 [Zetaproteobacteria bacterium CG_4_9_14_3_um_filter_49_83]|nr:MAG: hypothetical protein COW62_11150 [Zetaproteobacteria bacterium CG17_big_fil_post_rev_8_21_14_2_50_50_13]PIV29262.1 MAG: hypothetical protein COS35_13055 [Zetaproteobacteria bacterium CG02_land_8_20_14_3_00_50_9]PIY56097.1 MAG: hypothetical protein COZ00_06065 [Zetaproteobacteria bacterium CG_4_10_14_0_8_um_filter_49_80]PJA34537.1 MAG: hypothetical protein CO186_10305 [Zetaproteobacteria bacterium CG_4_9_14_3_um_filter_49_83]
MKFEVYCDESRPDLLCRGKMMAIDHSIRHTVLDGLTLQYIVRRAKVNIYVNRCAIVKGSV